MRAWRLGPETRSVCPVDRGRGWTSRRAGRSDRGGLVTPRLLGGPGRIRPTGSRLPRPIPCDLCPALVELRRFHPGILGAGHGQCLLHAPRGTRTSIAWRAVPEGLVARRLATVATAVYARRGSPAGDLFSMGWLAPDDSLAHLAAARWIAAGARRSHRAAGELCRPHSRPPHGRELAWRRCPASWANQTPSWCASWRRSRKWHPRGGGPGGGGPAGGPPPLAPPPPSSSDAPPRARARRARPRRRRPAPAPRPGPGSARRRARRGPDGRCSHAPHAGRQRRARGCAGRGRPAAGKGGCSAADRASARRSSA